MAELPIRPHLYYGGTACPGRLVEVLDQLKEDDMPNAWEETHDAVHENNLEPRLQSHGERIAHLNEQTKSLRAQVAVLRNRVEALEERSEGGGLNRGDTVKLI